MKRVERRNAFAKRTMEWAVRLDVRVRALTVRSMRNKWASCSSAGRLTFDAALPGSIAPKPHGGGWTPKFSGERLEELKKAVEQDPDATLAELLERSKVDASIMAVQRALVRLDCRRKKSRSTPQNKNARMSKPGATHGASRRQN